MMTEKLNTIARPYALAAFEYALEKNDLLAWEDMLNTAANIAQNNVVAALFHNPIVTTHELSKLFYDVLGSLLDAEKKNFIHLLVEKERLVALPEIAALFTQYRTNYEKTITVLVSSAIPLDEKHKVSFVESLTKRLKRKVTLQCETDEALLGGVMIRAGDLVIDGSVRGKLNRLVEFI